MAKILLRNSQNVIFVDKNIKYLISFCCNLVLYLEKIYFKTEISILLVDNKKIKKLNFKYRHKNKATDVLSFPTDNFRKYFRYGNVNVLGDIVISLERAKSQMFLYGSSCFEEEISRLTVHSMLHLLGYDHEQNFSKAVLMKKKENIINNIVSKKFKFERCKGNEI